MEEILWRGVGFYRTFLMNSLKKQLFLYLKARPNTWVHKSELGRYAESLGYINENGTRRMRELAESGRIETKLEATKEHGRTVFYRYVPSSYEVMHQNYQRNSQTLKLV